MKNIIEQLKSLFISREQKERLELARQQAEFARKEQEEKEKAERAIREQEKANAELARKEQKNREKAELANFMNEVEKKISEFEGRDENEIKLLRIILENNSALKDEKSKTALKTKNVPLFIIAIIDKLNDEQLLTEIALDSQDINLCNTIIEKISDESQLAKIAMYAWDNSIRKIALENITNDNILAKIAFWDTQDKRIRVKETWLGGVLGGWKIREEAVKRITDEGILEKIALDYGFHENVEVRAKAVEKITDENILIKIACSRDEYNVTLRTSAVRTLANENISTELALKLSNDKICGRSNLEYIISKLTNIKSLEEIAIKRPDFRYDVDKRLEYLKLNQLGVDELEILALNSINNPEGYNEELAIGIIDRLSIQNGQKALENITIASIMKKAWDVSEVAINKLQNHLILSDILKSDQFLHHKVFSAALKNTFDISAVEYFLSRPANFNLFHQAKIKLEQLNFLRVLKAAGDESYYINTIKKHLTDEVILSFLAEDKDLPESIRDEAIKKLTIVKKKEMNESI